MSDDGNFCCVAICSGGWQSRFSQTCELNSEFPIFIPSVHHQALKS